MGHCIGSHRLILAKQNPLVLYVNQGLVVWCFNYWWKWDMIQSCIMYVCVRGHIWEPCVCVCKTVGWHGPSDITLFDKEDPGLCHGPRLPGECFLTMRQYESNRFVAPTSPQLQVFFHKASGRLHYLAHYLTFRSVNLLHYHRIGFQTIQTFWLGALKSNRVHWKVW